MIIKNDILAIFPNYQGAFSWEELEKRLVKTPADRFAFKKALLQLTDEKVLIRTAAGIFYHSQNPDFHLGTVRVNHKNFGFVTDTKNPEAVYFIAPNNLGNTLDGDTAYFVLQKSSNPRFQGQEEARIIGVKEHQIHHLVGIARSSFKGNMYLQLNNLKLQQYRTSLVDSRNVKKDHYYEADLIEFKRGILFIKIIKDLGHQSSVGTDIMAVVAEFGLDSKFNAATLQETLKIPEKLSADTVNKAIANGRTDLRTVPLVTIDGDDSKDFDDAIAVKKLSNKNFELTVAIADVAAYVQPDSELDKTALKRGFSTYLIDQVIPMLPKKLSNGICSLNPNSERLCMVCVIQFSPTGTVVSTKIKEGVMSSHARLTYSEVNDMFKTGTWNHRDSLKAMLGEAFELYQILWSNRIKKGFVEFELAEPKFKLNDKKQIIDISYRSRGDAEKMIEAFMIAANEGVGTTIWKKDKMFIYRNHEKPSELKLNNLAKQLLSFNYHAEFAPTKIHSKDIQNVMTNLKAMNLDLSLLAPIFLRSMEKAKYQNFNLGHFGLASLCYTHFTSPIRRYADLLVHRYLKQYLFHQPMKDAHKTDVALGQICEKINSNEIITTDCERAVNGMKMAEYMHDREGQEFLGQVVAVVKFGLFVRLENSIEGLVHIRDLDDDFYEYSEDRFTLEGTSNHRVFKMGDKVKILVLKGDKLTRQIDFKIVG